MKLKYVLQLFIEFLIFIIYPFTLILIAAKILKPLEKAKLNNSKGSSIVIFEHWWTKIYYRIFMKLYLEKKGFRVYWVNFSLINGDIKGGVKFLDKFLTDNNIKDALLIGISIGAVSSYEYLQRYNGWKRVSRFIAIGGPFKGTPLAYFVPFVKAIKQITPKSKYLNKLMKEQVKNPDKILCITSAFDQIIPTSSSIIPLTKNKVIDIAGHNMLHIFSKELVKTIVKEARL